MPSCARSAASPPDDEAAFDRLQELNGKLAEEVVQQVLVPA
jgi:hypothetical protein